MALVSVLSFASLFLVASTVIVDRLSIYLMPLQIFVFSRLPYALGQRERSSPIPRPSLVVALAIGIGFGLMEFVWLNFSNNASSWIPYRLVTMG
jgi:hypothetical protein